MGLDDTLEQVSDKTQSLKARNNIFKLKIKCDLWFLIAKE